MKFNSWKLRVLVAWTCLLVGSVAAYAQSNPAPWQANADLVAERMRNSADFNYDESKVPQFTLPDALQTGGGLAVTTAEQWHDVRRPELMEIFREQVYGRRPEVEFGVQYKTLSKRDDAFDGLATGWEIQATIAIGDRTFQFPFVVFIPKRPVAEKSPVIVLINNRYFTPLDKASVEEDDFWPVRKLIERGYATASFHTSDVDPDREDGYAEGIRAFFADGQAPADDAWRSLSAWGWAASRVLDYMATLDSVDISRSAVVGHSRGGKTALWAACEDPRFAIAYSNNSGCGGAALSRRSYGETVARITTAFPHWFCKNFWAYADREQELPIDQHEVIALVAPRGVYVTSADEDLWADPRGEYQSLVAAAPVFELLGQKAVDETAMPGLNQQRLKGRTGYHIRTGGHGLEAADWSLFLDFADAQLHPKQSAAVK